MDSLTHIALGACIGEAFFDRNIGRKVLLWGALAQSLPDIDFVAGLWMPVSQELLAHRGFTHSLLFLVLVAPLLAIVAKRIHPELPVNSRKWIVFFGLEMLVHIFLDGFNNYGTGWLEPFSHERYSFNTLYVADPFFTIWPAIGAIALFLIPLLSAKRKFWMRFGLILPFIYLSYCVVNKFKIDHDVKILFAAQNIPADRYFTTPAPLNNWLWFVVSGDDNGYYVGFRSLFDQHRKMNFAYFPRNDSLLAGISDHADLKNLKRFSRQFYTVESWGDSLVFNDLRFGQIIGWRDAHEKFVFHYFLQHPDDNNLVVQRGRFAKWNKEIALSLWKRIKGN